jgi:hypothetical protein
MAVNRDQHDALMPFLPCLLLCDPLQSIFAHGIARNVEASDQRNANPFKTMRSKRKQLSGSIGTSAGWGNCCGLVWKWFGRANRSGALLLHLRKTHIVVLSSRIEPKLLALRIIDCAKSFLVRAAK